MKNKGAFIMGILWVLVALGLLYVLIKNPLAKLSWHGGRLSMDSLINIQNDVSLFESRTFNNADEIEVSTDSASVRFERTNEAFTVEFYGNWENAEIRTEVKDRTLQVTGKRKGPELMSNRSIVLKVPSSVKKLNGISVSSSSGSVRIESIDSSFITASLSSGSFKLDECKIDEVNVKSSSGSISLKECSSNNVIAGTSSGSIKFLDSKADFLDADTSSGSVTAEGNLSGTTVKTSSGSIRVTTSSPLVKDSSFTSSSGSIHLNMPEQTSYAAEYSSNSGSIRNSSTGFSCRGSGTEKINGGKIKLRLRTTSGSIYVNS